MTRPKSPFEVEQDIEKVAAELEVQTDNFRVDADAAAHAEADYKLAHAGMIVGLASQKMTAGERDARALSACREEFRAYKITEARKQATAEALRSLRTRMEALRTEAANRRYMDGGSH